MKESLKMNHGLNFEFLSLYKLWIIKDLEISSQNSNLKNKTQVGMKKDRLEMDKNQFKQKKREKYILGTGVT